LNLIAFVRNLILLAFLFDVVVEITVMIKKLIFPLLLIILINILPGCSMIYGPANFRILMSGDLNNRLGPCG